MKEEIFRDVKFKNRKGIEYDFTGYYQVSNLGKIKSLDFNHTGKEGILKNHIAGNYEQALLVKNNEKVYVSVNRLVAFAFPEICGEWFKGAVCNHKDENKLNNCASNLEWCSVSYNNTYGTRIERMVNSSRKSALTIPVIQFDKNYNYIKEWISASEIERELGFAQANVSACCRGKYKQAYGYIWKYKKAV